MSHTYKFKLSDGRRFALIGNGDLSGEFRIVEVSGPDPINDPTGPDTTRDVGTVPGEVLRLFAADWATGRMFDALEQGRALDLLIDPELGSLRAAAIEASHAPERVVCWCGHPKNEHLYVTRRPCRHPKCSCKGFEGC